MADWWTYRPEDFLHFSERVYWRLFELNNQAVWPVQIIAIVLGAVILALLLRPNVLSNRAIAIILATAWSFVALTYFRKEYATISWAAQFVVPLFLVEAILLAWLGGFRNQLAISVHGKTWGYVRLAILIYALAFHPLIALLGGRPLASAEIFGIAPDPTAIATLALLALSGGGGAVILLLIIPTSWCVFNGATLLTMGTWEGWIPLATVAFTLTARPWRRTSTAK